MKTAAETNAASTSLGLRAYDESTAASSNDFFKTFRSAEHTLAPYIAVNYNSYPAYGGRLGISGGNVYTDPDGVTRVYVPSLTPRFFSAVVDPDPGQDVRALFDVHSGSTKVIERHPGAYVASGGISRASATAVGALVEGTEYIVRAWAQDRAGLVSKSWSSSYGRLILDTTAPAGPAVSSTAYPADGSWRGGAGQAGSFTLSPASTADAGYLSYWLDDDTPTVVKTTGSATVSITPPTDGPHTLHVQARDRAGNPSPVVGHAFNVGAGVLVSPAAGARTDKRFTVEVKASSAHTGVRLEYRRGAADPWSPVPSAHVTDATGATSTDGLWPLTGTGGTVSVTGLRWDAVATFGGDGTGELRPVLTGSTGGDTPAAASAVTVDQASSAAAATGVGPGSVNLRTGDYRISGADAAVFGVSIGRTASSRDPQAGDRNAVLASPFGPQWALGGVADVAGTGYQGLTSAGTTATVWLEDGTGLHFTKSSGTGTATTWTPEPGGEGITLTGEGTPTAPFVLVDTDGTRTTFTAGADAGEHVVATTTPTGAGNTTRYAFEPAPGQAGKLRLKRLIAPTAAVADLGTCDAAAPPVGCRVLELTYTPDTATAPADGTTGPYPGRAATVVLHAAVPGSTAGAATMTSVAVTQYRYDSAGRLAQVLDPRLPDLVTGYGYDTAGRVTTLTPPGEQPWTLAYETSGAATGRLVSAARPTLAAGSRDTVSGTATTRLAYGVPLTKAAGGPYDMDAAAVATWRQPGEAAPVDATAVLAPDVADGDHARASVHYLDLDGREVNRAAPGGHIATTVYDQFGNTVRELTAGNRALALATAADADRWTRLQDLGLATAATADRAEELSTVSVYSADGVRELEQWGPRRLAWVGDGPVLARPHTVNAYDEGRPAGAPVKDLVTTTTTGARVVGAATDVATLTSRTEYDWTLGLPTKTITDPAGLAITRTTAYDDAGRVVKTTMPKSTGADAGTTLTSYYTAGTASDGCGDRPEWDGMVCRVAPGGAITGGGTNPDQLPTATTTYTTLGAVDTVTETANGVTRSTTTGYDTAGRPIRAAVTGGLGQAVPATSTGYDPGTGRVVSTTSEDGGTRPSITRGYDALGRLTSYTDATGATSTTAYDALDRPTSITRGDGTTTTYGYDPAAEPRGMPVKVTDSVAGAVTGRYDADGNLVEHTLPGGFVMRDEYDPSGAPVARTWTQTTPTGDVLLVDEQVVENVHGQWTTHAGKASSQSYGYDAAGRLTTVQDTVAGACTNRVYGFDADGNRTHKAQESGTSQTCPATPALGAAVHAYDSADRLVDTGYAYDAFGRTTALPGATVGYHVTDLAAEQKTPTRDQTWSLDPTGERFTSTTITTKDTTGTVTSVVTKTNHYTGDGDTPDWTVDGATGTERYVVGLTGDLAATTSAAGTRLQLANLHGDVTMVIDPAAASRDGDLVLDADEYGQPRPGTPTPRYGWLGAKQRDTDTPTGLLLMGVRLYNPATGRFLSVDPIPGGNENAYNYPNDPINMFDLDGKWREWLKERWRATRRGASSAGRWLNRHKDTIAVGLAVVGMFTCSICTIAAYGAIAIGTASAVSSCRRGISVGCATGAISAFAGGKARLLRGAAKWALRGARSGHGKLSSFRRAVGRGWLRQARWSDRVSLGTGVASAFCSYRSC